MNILYCGDSNIRDGVLLSVLSLLRSTTEPLNIYILTATVKTTDRVCHALPEAFAAFLNRQVKEEDCRHSVTLMDITSLFAAQLPTANLSTRFTPCCMLRLYADRVPELPDRVLYLDNDVLCRRDFREFYYSHMDDEEIVGVLDHYGKWFFRRNPFRMDYLNSGVLLLNLKKIRETGLLENCRRRCQTTTMFMPDQSALNKLAVHKKIVPRRYNEQRKLRQDTVFQHFTTGFRFFPWVHTVSVKPWDTKRLHDVLKIHEYDHLLCEYQQWKQELTKPKEESLK